MTAAGVSALRAERAALPDPSAWDAVCHRLGPSVEPDDLAAMQVPVSGDLLRDFGPLGKHPTHLWADGLVHACVVHRCFEQGGELLPASVAPAIRWFESALPQVACTGLHRVLDEPVAFALDRPIILWRVGDSVALGESPAGVVAAAAIVRVDPVALLRFTSGCSRWTDEDVVIAGDVELARRVLDEMRI